AIDQIEQQVAAVREFNRSYTRQIGVLNREFLDSPFSLAEVRVLLELYYRDASTASTIGQALGLDAGYLSRIVRGFARRGLIARESSPTDGRQRLLRLSKAGRKAFEEIETKQRAAVREMLEPLSAATRPTLIGSMQKIEQLLGLAAASATATPYVLRTHRSGDMGWIIHRQGILYREEYGWDEHFEALVAEICANYIKNEDPRRERCWVAERGGGIVGAIFCVARSKTVAQLRLLYVEPSARGLGIGGRLVEECIHFAQGAGYRKMMLWTNDVLHSARKIYEATGFKLVEEEKHHSFGRDLVAQTWELDLKAEA
ncbi:MAG TPA: bifunctional helix-turn-helix transcriptional regulator/GNAT family N-acetyltransferase, partial [Gemmatimonadaceae bacterium]|nr:bifunctional helix-turn-helix transcriptional regulator/GNAT family N-acetyltransferase [Gemmatimonadaceae bacterium]